MAEHSKKPRFIGRMTTVADNVPKVAVFQIATNLQAAAALENFVQRQWVGSELRRHVFLWLKPDFNEKKSDFLAVSSRKSSVARVQAVL